MSDKFKCICGFEFAGPGEIRNCEAFVTAKGEGGIICPECKQAYVNRLPVTLETDEQ